MEEFVSNGRAIKFSAESGRVLPGHQKTTKTHITSSGGGGYVNQGTGYVDAAQIKSTTTTEQDFWLLAESGRQVPVRIAGDTMAVNVDQEVSLLHARHPTKDVQWLVGIVNHSAGTTAWLLSPMGLVQNAGLASWWRPVLLSLLSFVPFSLVGFWFLGLVSSGVILFRHFRKETAIAKSLGHHLWRLQQSLMARSPLTVSANGQP